MLNFSFSLRVTNIKQAKTSIFKVNFELPTNYNKHFIVAQGCFIKLMICGKDIWQELSPQTF